MCGIAGIHNHGKKAGDVRGILGMMAAAIRHRGPDAETDYVDETSAIVFRRLSIIDVDKGGQPVSDERGGIVAFMNGEIVNYIELREDLEKRGHRFLTSSDTEVIPHLYEEEGEEFVHRLEGMFAIVLLDLKRQTLFLLRDRFGIKPLYYAERNGSLIFSSEIKGILASGLVRREVNHLALGMAFHTHFVQPPHTMFKGVYSLEPGHLLEVKGKALKKRRYYRLHDRTARKRPDGKDLLEEIMAVMGGVMSRWVRSDVPVGVSQSGGIDSSVIMAHSSRLANCIYSITGDLKSERYLPDEVRFARIMAEKTGAEQEIISIDMDGILDRMPAAMWHNENLNLAPAYMNHYLIAGAASRKVRVLLGGTGGDELFYGYPQYDFRRIERFFSLLPASVKKTALLPVRAAGSISNRAMIAYEWLRAWTDLPESYSRKQIYTTRFLYPSEVSQLLKLGYDPGPIEKKYADFLKEGYDGDMLNAIMYADIHTLVASHQLLQTDIAGMAHSVENRPPFMDHNLVELMASVPSRIKKGAPREKKSLLKRIYRNEIPLEILKGKKTGFSSPLHEQANGRFRSAARGIIHNKKRMVEIGIDKRFVSSMIEGCAADWKKAEAVYGVVAYAAWHRAHIELGLTERPEAEIEEFLS